MSGKTPEEIEKYKKEFEEKERKKWQFFWIIISIISMFFITYYGNAVVVVSMVVLWWATGFVAREDGEELGRYKEKIRRDQEEWEKEEDRKYKKWAEENADLLQALEEEEERLEQERRKMYRKKSEIRKGKKEDEN